MADLGPKGALGALLGGAREGSLHWLVIGDG